MVALLRHYNHNVILQLMRRLQHSYLPFSFICITFNACSDEQSSLCGVWYFTLTGQFSHHINFPRSKSLFPSILKDAAGLILCGFVGKPLSLLMMAALFLRLLVKLWAVVIRRCVTPVSTTTRLWCLWARCVRGSVLRSLNGFLVLHGCQ